MTIIILLSHKVIPVVKNLASNFDHLFSNDNLYVFTVRKDY